MKLFATFAIVIAAVLAASATVDAQDSVFTKATYSHSLAENQMPQDTADFFYPDETIYLSVELKGRPKSGEVTAKFLLKDELIAETKLDVAEINKGIIFSFGQNTFVGLSLKPGNSLPIGTDYRTDVTFNGKPLGSFPFKVAPPKDALPSVLKSVTLAKGIAEGNKPVGETREFTQLEKVVFAGVADLGLGSALEVTWLVNGKPDEAGTKSFTMQENKKAVPFYFSYVPGRGWPVGTQEVFLTLDGKEVAREKFNIKADPGVGNVKVDVTSVSLHRDDGQGEAGEEVASFSTKDMILHLECSLAKPAIPQGVKFVWTLVKAGDEENVEIAVAEIDETTLNRSLSTSLRTKRGLPAGIYRVDLIQGGKVLMSRKFEVK